jgi:methylated-DNA-[protein]-cysteine S-methyltransferase
LSGTSEEQTLLERLEAELKEYAQGRRRNFDLPLDPEGTPFQRQVWEQLKGIPYGERKTYGALAAALGKPAAARAVGAACGKNPIVVLIPCHRVVGRDGSLTGYSALGGTETKRRLLELEQKFAEETP